MMTLKLCNKFSINKIKLYTNNKNIYCRIIKYSCDNKYHVWDCKTSHVKYRKCIC